MNQNPYCIYYDLRMPLEIFLRTSLNRTCDITEKAAKLANLQSNLCSEASISTRSGMDFRYL